MSDAPSELNPQTLEKYFRSATVTTHRVGESPQMDVRIDAPGQKISLLTPHSGAVQNTASMRRVSTGVETRDGLTWARFTVDARNMYTEAYGLVISVAQAMTGGATFAAATSAAMTNMKALLAAKPRIPDEKQIGLVGELMVLRSLLDDHDEIEALGWWLGPLAEERDFAFPVFDAEVKTTLSEKRSHIIHGAGQLEPSPGRSLWLVSVQITRAGGDPSGLSLPDLVHAVRERLSSTRDTFVRHMAGEGWDDDDAEMYPATYVLRTAPAAYLVDDDFPAVTTVRLRAVVPHSDLVSAVNYRVDLDTRTPGSPGDPLTTFLANSTPQES